MPVNYPDKAYPQPSVYWWERSNFSSYKYDFRFIDSKYPAEFPFTTVMNNLKKKEKPVVIDLMGGSEALVELRSDLRTPDFRGLGVVYKDPGINSEQETRKQAGVEVVEMDLSRLANYRQIRNWLNHDKADLIMERGRGGLHFVPTVLDYEKSAMQRLWKMTNPQGGAIILQTPPLEIFEMRNIHIAKWVDQVRSDNIQCYYVPKYECEVSQAYYGLLMMIHDTPEQSLPELI